MNLRKALCKDCLTITTNVIYSQQELVCRKCKNILIEEGKETHCCTLFSGLATIELIKIYSSDLKKEYNEKIAFAEKSKLKNLNILKKIPEEDWPIFSSGSQISKSNYYFVLKEIKQYAKTKRVELETVRQFLHYFIIKEDNIFQDLSKVITVVGWNCLYKIYKLLGFEPQKVGRHSKGKIVKGKKTLFKKAA